MVEFLSIHLVSNPAYAHTVKSLIGSQSNCLLQLITVLLHQLWYFDVEPFANNIGQLAHFHNYGSLVWTYIDLTTPSFPVWRFAAWKILRITGGGDVGEGGWLQIPQYWPHFDKREVKDVNLGTSICNWMMDRGIGRIYCVTKLYILLDVFT